MNFIPLYSNTKIEREQRTVQERNQNSRFFNHQSGNNEDGSVPTDIQCFSITDNMKELLRSLDGYVFAVEASSSEQAGTTQAQCAHNTTSRHVSRALLNCSVSYSILHELLSSTGIEFARSELFSMINDLWCDPVAPLTILACTPTHDTPRLSSIQLVRELSLSRLNRPWQVMFLQIYIATTRLLSTYCARTFAC